MLNRNKLSNTVSEINTAMKVLTKMIRISMKTWNKFSSWKFVKIVQNLWKSEIKSHFGILINIPENPKKGRYGEMDQIINISENAKSMPCMRIWPKLSISLKPKIYAAFWVFQNICNSSNKRCFWGFDQNGQKFWKREIKVVLKTFWPEWLKYLETFFRNQTKIIIIYLKKLNKCSFWDVDHKIQYLW